MTPLSFTQLHSPYASEASARRLNVKGNVNINVNVS
jgi:hypothetical protein